MAEKEPRGLGSLASKRVEQITADRGRLKVAIGGGVRVRIHEGPLTQLGGEKDPFTETDIDAFLAKEWGPQKNWR